MLFNWTNTWTRGPWSVDLRWNYVGDFDARTPEQAQILNVPDPGRIGAYQTFDLFVGYDFPWKGRLRVGARNIADKLPTLSRFAYGDFGYSRPLHDVNGRVLVASYTQTFK
jgi:outer membrane receptor protein involved in Fe transport